MTKKKAVRNYKDSVFRMLFRGKKELLSLYNAVNGKHYTDENELEVTTLENAIYMNMKNDVSCVLDLRMNLYEHQSTVNPNMPLRDLFYVARLFERLISGRDIYSVERIMLPTPKFIVFYNGVDSQPETKVMHLSDSFLSQMEQVNLDLVVTQFNINSGFHEPLKKNCPYLREYMQYVERVRKYSREMSLEESVERAVEECIEEGILRDFLIKNRAEVVQMSIFEYDEELHLNTLREEGFAAGRKDMLKRMLASDITDAQMLSCGYTQAEIDEAKRDRA